RKYFQCDFTVKRGVFGEIHLAHPACANLRADFVTADFCAWVHLFVTAECPCAAASRRSGGRCGLNPTLDHLYKRTLWRLLLIHVPAMKMPTPSRSGSHRSWQSSAPRSGSGPTCLPVP